MNEVGKVSQRDMRKRLLQLEAQTYRLEMVANMQDLRRPMNHLDRAPALLNLLGIKSSLLNAATAILTRKRLRWVVRLLPLAVAGWRMGKLINGLVVKRNKALRLQQD